jgi:alpha-galactosidase
MKTEHDKKRVSEFRLRSTIFLCIILFSANSFGWPKKNQLPPMGWEPWNIDHCGQLSYWDEAYYRKLADFFVSSGLKDLGYTYLTFECNAHYRDANGVFQPNLTKFPNGFKPINDYLHSKGLKSRAYTDAGKGKCGGCFDGDGSYGHYADDAKRWAEFGFDGVKIDWCGGASEKLDAKTQFMEFHKEMAMHNPDFNIEICTWGRGNPWEWGRDAGTFWRTGEDIDGYIENGKWFEVKGGSWKMLIRNIDANRHSNKNLVGPGLGWNYPDMLEIGINGGLDETEERTQFSMWCIMASPLFLGNDVLNMPEYAKEIVMNREMIAIDQDPLGIQGDVVKEYNNNSLQLWMKELGDGSKAVALFNRSDKAEKITALWKDLGITGRMKVRDLWEHSDKGMFTNNYSVEVQPHAAVVIKISKP